MLAMELTRRAVLREKGSRADRAWPSGWSLVAWLAVFAMTSFKDIDVRLAKSSRLVLQEKLWNESRTLFERVHGLARPTSYPAKTAASVAIVSEQVFAMRTCALPSIISFGLGDGASAGSSSTSRCERATMASASSSSTKKRKRGAQWWRCDVCGDPFEDYASWDGHVRHSSYCAEAGAEPVPFDSQQEALDDALQVSRDAIYKADVQSQLLCGYSALEYDRLVPRAAIQTGMKEGVVEPLVNTIKEEIYRRLAKSPEERTSLESIIGSVFDVHRGIETTAKEENALRATINPVAPVRRELVDTPGADGKATGPRRGDFVYDIPIQSELEALAEANPGLLDELRAASDAWGKTGPAAGASTKVYVDISDGAVMQMHSQLGTEADRSDGSVRLAFVLYYDDLEVPRFNCFLPLSSPLSLSNISPSIKLW